VELIVAITGASGAILGVRFLEKSRELGVKTHLIVSKWGLATLKAEANIPLNDLESLADQYYSNDDLLAPFSSGSYKFDGMVVIPCSMNTLAMVANGMSDDLITRAASVTLKEKRKLVLVTRETPLNLIQIENMARVARAGGVILPPVLTFYHNPQKIEDLLDYVIGKVFDQFGIKHNLFKRWGE
jgi:4-hydroxy-3-polyprenylbenzoate decarboxylase